MVLDFGFCQLSLLTAIQTGQNTDLPFQAHKHQSSDSYLFKFHYFFVIWNKHNRYISTKPASMLVGSLSGYVCLLVCF